MIRLGRALLLQALLSCGSSMLVPTNSNMYAVAGVCWERDLLSVYLSIYCQVSTLSSAVASTTRGTEEPNPLLLISVYMPTQLMQ